MKKPPLILISGSTASKGVEFGDASLSLSLNYALAIQAAAGEIPRQKPSTRCDQLVKRFV